MQHACQLPRQAAAHMVCYVVSALSDSGLLVWPSSHIAGVAQLNVLEKSDIVQAMKSDMPYVPCEHTGPPCGLEWSYRRHVHFLIPT